MSSPIPPLRLRPVLPADRVHPAGTPPRPTARRWPEAPAAPPVPADLEITRRVLADGGSITVARRLVDGRTVHIDAVVR